MELADSLSQHPFFRPWTDPAGGAVSWLLSERVAPVQQTFYFVNPSLSADQRWLWFYTSFPPNRQKTLGVVCLDPAAPLIRHFPQAGFSGSSPMVLPEGDAVLLCIDATVWRLGVDGAMTAVLSLSEEYIARRRVERLATHLSRSADGRYLLLDAHVGNQWAVAIGEIATGRVSVIKEFATQHNHGQFSPVDPELLLIPADHHVDPHTGRFTHHDFRVFLMDIRGRQFQCLTPHVHCEHLHGICHEWWSRDGLVCYVDYDRGACEMSLADRREVLVWPEPLCHAHCSADRQLWCADQSPYFWDERPCEVKFFDRRGGQVRHIVTAMPKPPLPRKGYHLDPHPQFSPQDDCVVYTTMVAGAVDVALCPVDGLR